MTSRAQTIVLDFDGLASYPGFPKMLKEIMGTGKRVVFWTFNHSEAAKEFLGSLDTAEANVPVIGRQEQSYLRGKCIYSPVPHDEIFPYLANLGIPQDRNVGYLNNQASSWYYMDDVFHDYKFPPILGEGDYLLVESDQSKRERFGIWEAPATRSR